jgi:hypothetical protein
MLAHILALTVGLSSFGLYMSAFFFPEVHRKNDFTWSGVGMFYALVLWVCAGRITGGVLLGQTASVVLLGWLGWQTLALRRTLTPRDQQTQLPGSAKSLGEALQSGWKQLQTTLLQRLQKLPLLNNLVQPVAGVFAAIPRGYLFKIASSLQNLLKPKPKPKRSPKPHSPKSRANQSTSAADEKVEAPVEVEEAIAKFEDSDELDEFEDLDELELTESSDPSTPSTAELIPEAEVIPEKSSGAIAPETSEASTEEIQTEEIQTEEIQTAAISAAESSVADTSEVLEESKEPGKTENLNGAIASPDDSSS